MPAFTLAMSSADYDVPDDIELSGLITIEDVIEDLIQEVVTTIVLSSSFFIVISNALILLSLTFDPSISA